jgi:hypothetical protein
MKRIFVVVEGPTEEAFINEVLAKAMWCRQVHLTPIVMGGNTKYQRVKRDVLRLLKQDPGACCSTMLDYYGLGKGFPGMPLPENLPNNDKVLRVEMAMKKDIIEEDSRLRADVWFVPYLQLHEYEGLLFGDPAVFADAIGQPQLSRRLQIIRSSFATPEDSNEDPNRAPSKRILGIYPAYQKVVDGALAAERIGIDRMRAECPHFRDWLERLSALGEA